MSKKSLTLIVGPVLMALLALILITPHFVYADNSFEPDWLPPELEVTPESQPVTSSDGYHAEWDTCIYEGTGTYTMDFWSGDGSHYTRVMVDHASCEPWGYYYVGSTGWYYQTWQITGQGGPDYDSTRVQKY
jgi:hypothetical protein